MPHFRTSSIVRNSSLSVERVACDGVDHGGPRPERLDGDRIVIVVRGRFGYRDRGTRAACPPGAMIGVRSNEEFQIEHFDGEGDVCLSVRGDVATDLLNGGHRVRRLDTDSFVRLLERCAAWRAAEPDTTLEIEEDLSQLCAAGGASRSSDRRSDVVAESIADEVQRKFEGPLTLKQLAERAGVSVFHACRSFRRARKTTIHGYRRDLQLKSAVSLLLDTDYPLTRIAVDTGFANQGHFTNAFRRRFGMPPSVFRRQRSWKAAR
jgi:AraC family transcriptional regulator